jgi:hypothetical protein
MNALSNGEQEGQWLKFLVEELWKKKPLTHAILY